MMVRNAIERLISHKKVLAIKTNELNKIIVVDRMTWLDWDEVTKVL